MGFIGCTGFMVFWWFKGFVGFRVSLNKCPDFFLCKDPEGFANIRVFNIAALFTTMGGGNLAPSQVRTMGFLP